MVIYTDGSCRHALGWAWCCGEHYGYGINTQPKYFNLSYAAELFSVIDAVKNNLHLTQMVIVNDHSSVVRHINEQDWLGTIKRKRSKQLPELINQLHDLLKGKDVKAVFPWMKDRDRHGWCHNNSRRCSISKKRVTEFESWWDKNKPKPAATEQDQCLSKRNTLLLEAGKEKAANKFFKESIGKILPPPKEHPLEIEILEGTYSFAPIEVR